MNVVGIFNGREVKVLEEMFNARADDLAEEKSQGTLQYKEKFLDIVSNVKDDDLKQRLINQYLKADDEAGNECGKLIKKYYKSRHG